MNIRVLCFYLVSMFFIFPVPGESAEVAHPEFNRIKAEELKQSMDKKGDFILVDSRDSEKYGQGHIEGALNIHFDDSGDPMARQMSLMTLPMDKLIIVYCDAENEGISAGLVLDLYDMGYDMDMIKILSGGIAGWNASGYSLVTTGN